MLDPDEAKRIVLEHTQLKAPLSIGLEESLGFVLAEDVQATCSVPAFDNSAMDGYAMRTGDLIYASEVAPVSLKMIDFIAAGDRSLQPLEQGECFQIATGAELPCGADTIVMKEQARADGDRIWFMQAPQKNQHVRFKGEDIQEGQIVLSRGEKIGPSQVTLLAAFGYSRVLVQPPLNVVVITTGSELIDVDLPLEPGKIRDVNSYMLAALAREEQCNTHRVGIVKDDPRLIYEVLNAHIQADLILITGGVSMGERDFVKDALVDIGAEEIFWKVRIKPGKPFYFAIHQRGENEKTLIFGLPGNPAAGYVIFEEYARPSIRKAMGRRKLENSFITAELDYDITEQSDRRQFIRAFLRKDQNQFHVAPLPVQGSHSLSSLAGANALVVVPENEEILPKGASVKVRPLISTVAMEL